VVKVLLIGNAAIDGDENVKAGGSSRVQQSGITKSGKTSVTGRPAIVGGQMTTQALGQAFVE
jgi:hypothetical protein